LAVVPEVLGARRAARACALARPVLSPSYGESHGNRRRLKSVPGPYFLTFEALCCVLYAICVAHAWRKGPAAVLELVAAALFGLLLEWATIQQLQAYQYGHFLLMVGEVPVSIALGWGAIIYSARQYSDATSLPQWARPVLDGLLALNVDLSMDAIAIRLGFWNWAIGAHAQYFGVPWANFWAWFWVVFFFSAALRLLRRWHHPIARGLAPFGAIIIGVLGVLLTNFIIRLTRGTPAYVPTVGGVLVGALLLVFLLRPRLDVSPKPAVTAWIPGGFHVYFLAAGLLSGAALRPPFLLAVSLAMLGVATFVQRKGRVFVPMTPL
jgi:hypothetical protein